ncbi:MAG: sortase, partial [Candidatus Gracilibacteria bacterium]|nr:sortase [Candidatus Gracilibacteria bacterium]
MKENNIENIDILENIDLSALYSENTDNTNTIIENINENDSYIKELEMSLEQEISQIDISTISNNNAVENSTSDIDTTKNEIAGEDILKNVITKNNNTKIKRNNFVSGIVFLSKYILTSSLIFGVLLVSTNYSAYLSVAKSYIFKGELENKQQALISSVEASSIKDKYAEEKLKQIETETGEIDSELSINKMKKSQDKENINLDIEITPYENRIVIPKIGKNVPLVDIKNRNIDGQKELNNIFMQELENGVIRYPGSAKPGQEGTSFIFGHSSNFPWIKGDYNDVFALLDKVVYNDEIVVYYGQEKYTYKIREKKVITPGDVSVLERNKKKSEITLMT